MALDSLAVESDLRALTHERFAILLVGLANASHATNNGDLTTTIEVAGVVQGQEAIVTSIETKEVYKKRPKPLNTVAALKTLSTHLRLSASKSMELMESLYTKGLLSYPRTETDSYPST